MKNEDLFELVNKVEDEDDFLDFINELSEDRIKSLQKKSSEDWENDTIEDFFERAHEWGVASKEGLRYYEKPQNPWKRCAQILYMGKIYE
ncbi:DUF7660 family protein [Clostridium cellulovorans]|uniref:DUF7660 domain-containing protein n=1 Tax=Clostridium cellulovorans (strain ATCC 35296 / DSM 3052 / OCM 3 / 743B) TaxID=573061 RepID=D9SW45_CLOC7|nr:hypothetical protein [Clostridium cellulovorans]ADL51189.1 hypothetical protein Clocel_1436 [Clostridium cellulovorans 743B]